MDAKTLLLGLCQASNANPLIMDREMTETNGDFLAAYYGTTAVLETGRTMPNCQYLAVKEPLTLKDGRFIPVAAIVAFAGEKIYLYLID